MDDTTRSGGRSSLTIVTVPALGEAEAVGGVRVSVRITDSLLSNAVSSIGVTTTSALRRPRLDGHRARKRHVVGAGDGGAGDGVLHGQRLRWYRRRG